MSYILEALKKAQAERQLGTTPDIHAQAPLGAPVAAPGAQRKPLLLGLGAGIVIAGAAAALAWRGQAPQAAGEPAVLAQAAPSVTASATASATLPATAPASTAVSVPEPEPAPAPAAPLAAPKPVAKAQVAEVPAAPAPAPTSPAPVRNDAPPPAARTAAATPVPVRDSVPEAVYLPAPAAQAPVVRVPEPPIDENLRSLQQLPEAIQREVPKLSFGGYIYSPNPAERLLLVDKVLRREGEEVAPGLVLERLMPKYAVMNFRGTRYRVGY